MEIRIQGPHQAALRRRSLKVFDGAMNVLRMRAPSDSGGTVGVEEEETGGSGATAITASFKMQGILVRAGLGHKLADGEIFGSMSRGSWPAALYLAKTSPLAAS